MVSDPFDHAFDRLAGLTTSLGSASFVAGYRADAVGKMPQDEAARRALQQVNWSKGCAGKNGFGQTGRGDGRIDRSRRRSRCGTKPPPAPSSWSNGQLVKWTNWSKGQIVEHAVKLNVK